VTTDSAPPEGYTEPSVVYCVEYVDPREPEAGWHQLGAFTTESEAQRLRGRLVAEGFFAELLINLTPATSGWRTGSGTDKANVRTSA
jgi:hypothetical protein